MHCLFSMLTNLMDHSENHRVVGLTIFFHLVSFSFPPYQRVEMSVWIDQCRETVRRKRRVVLVGVEDQEVHFDLRRGAERFLSMFK
jgi:hypothetical protein